MAKTSSLPESLLLTRTALEKGELSSVELVEHSLDVIESEDKDINAFLEVFKEESLAQAKEVDAARASNQDVGSLAGIPIGIKDAICTTEGHTTAASKMLANFKSPYDATVVRKLKDEGAIVIGKTNLDEFAMGSSTEYSAYGVTKNPVDKSRVSGGSSGGSAAAVASGEVLTALGTDTGGSIRQPASFCGVVGVKPTYGRVSRHGLIAYGSSLDQAGPFTKNVKDAALMLNIMAGQDDLDATTSNKPVEDYVSACGESVKDMVIGVPKEFFETGLDPEVNNTIEAALERLKSLGAKTKEISLPSTEAAIAVYYLIAKAEASSNLARYDSLRYGEMALESQALIDRYMEARGKGFGPEVKRAILMGTYALSAGYYDAWYKQAEKVRNLIKKEYEQAWQEVDVIAGPVVPEVAFQINSKTDDPLKMYLSDALTVPLSVAGLPAISVPCGEAHKLPVGLQIAAPAWQESRMFKAAYALEESLA